jgi:hypothetical protein
MKSILFSILLIAFAATAKDNPFVIDSVSFDTRLLRFKISWHADTTSLSQNIQYGITATCDSFNNDPPFSRTTLKKLSSDTILILPELKYDTLYSVGIWAYFGGKWFEPDSQSRKKVFVSSVSSQPVSMFAPAKVCDTIKALNNQVILWKDSSFHLGIPPHQDTVIAFTPPDSILKGFIKLSTGIRFAHPEPSLPFFIALAIDKIPTKCRIGQIHLYRDSSGLFIPVDSSFVDTQKMQVTVKTGNVRLPLVALADTTPPVITIKSDTSLIIDSKTLYDTVMVSDNSSNLVWYFYQAPGSELPGKESLSGTIKGHSGRIICPISSVGAQTNGIRAVLICSDGTYRDTINLSKRGLRKHSDPVTIPEKKIVPISTTSLLYNTGIKSILKPLFDQSGGSYNQSYFRIYRWMPDIQNGWTEYSSKNEQSFSLTPGMTIWLICSKSQLIDLGKGTTVSLKDTVKIILPPHNWTDINNPFGFDLKLTDILHASGIPSENVTIYKWLDDQANNTYKTSLVHSSAVAGLDSSRDTLLSMQSGYTVYNHTNSVLIMRFPPVPYGSSGLSKQTFEKNNTNDFSMKITARTENTGLGSVYCGIHNNSNDTLASPLPPSFGSHAIMIRCQENVDSSGILSYPASDSDPAIFNIAIKYKDTDARISVNTDVLAKNFTTQYAMFIKNENGLEPFTGKGLTLHNGQGSFILVAGKAAAINSFASGYLNQSTISPCVNIKFEHRKILLEIAGIKQSTCSFELYTLQGKRVSVQKFTQTLTKSISLPASVPAGVYVMKLAFTKENRTIFSTVRKISFLNEVR